MSDPPGCKTEMSFGSQTAADVPFIVNLHIWGTEWERVRRVFNETYAQVKADPALFIAERYQPS